MSEHDSRFQSLADISKTLENEYVTPEDAWNGSPFAWIRGRASRQVGKIGEQLVSRWLEDAGFRVERSPDSQADRIVEKLRVEVKLSTLWKTGTYTFQQLRDQSYDCAVCLGISPFSAHCWILPKAEILYHWRESGNIPSQHGGKGATDTAWFKVDPAAPPPWLTPFGGTLNEAVHRLSQLIDQATDRRRPR